MSYTPLDGGSGHHNGTVRPPEIYRPEFQRSELQRSEFQRSELQRPEFSSRPSMKKTMTNVSSYNNAAYESTPYTNTSYNDAHPVIGRSQSSKPNARTKLPILPGSRMGGMIKSGLGGSGFRSGLRSGQSRRSGRGKEPTGVLNLLIKFWPISVFFGFIPLGFASRILGWADPLVFATNFLAIVPLAWIMGVATEDCAAAFGTIIGGLMNAWFGNIVEMLLCIAGLRQGELVVVRCTLIGSILSNLLLVAGCSLFVGGLFYKVQEFSAVGASTTTSLLMLGAFCAGMPSMYSVVSGTGFDETLKMSRCVAFFLVVMYAQFMIFQLRTHSFLYTPVTEEEDDDQEEEVSMGPCAAAVVLGVGTVLCSFSSEFLIASIQGTVSSFHISKEFIGIILLPIIGNAAEHYTSVVVAIHNSMDLSLGCAVGSACQMLLFVTPVTVLVGWIVQQPMSLDLHAFEILVLVLAIIIITGILQDGYSNWLEGSILCSAYAVIAVVYFFENPKLSDVI
ncbi:calcium/proton exchanger [Gregarina niphandrodes]|uniref:Calcium/proton exchanger n=1 Tax=Gregarina niphandrodes TaxID=110365 RepID=A0A023AYA7_GRENI|nr:calcium/proton exchanger [Gregarina niphandrodes]EZG43644.1 calcium/proton exchanger [Gregarina niphandrodes]|eukprot:XP_011133118.1 calcium/proton exchanger [Gregarina niphandrodes]